MLKVGDKIRAKTNLKCSVTGESWIKGETQIITEIKYLLYIF